MLDQILNNALKRLLVAQLLVALPQPVLQHLLRTRRHALQGLDVRPHLVVREAVQRGVRGRAETADGGEVELWRGRLAAAAAGGVRVGWGAAGVEGCGGALLAVLFVAFAVRTGCAVAVVVVMAGGCGGVEVDGGEDEFLLFGRREDLVEVYWDA